jgi:hypothetical protein
MAKPIYELILENIEDGKLSRSFSLPREDGGTDLRFADGALDGITVFHTGKTEMNAAAKKLMLKALNTANRDDPVEAEKQFYELSKTCSAISVVDEFQDYIMDNYRRLDAGRVFRTALQMIYYSEHRECVKYGLVILELMADLDDDEKTAVRRLALSDEFTLPALWVMSKWKNGNAEIFGLAKKVTGWGRIHAVARLKPETPEIRRWLLLEGINNDVMPQYSALTVWKKAGIGELLHGSLSDEDFHAVSLIISALINEGPVQGISGIDHPEEYLTDYLYAAETVSLDIDDYDTVFDIDCWASNGEHEFPDIAERCADILSTELCEDSVREAARTGCGLKLAEALGIDVADDFYEFFCNDYENQFHQCGFLTSDPRYYNRVLDVFREKLPLNMMSAEPGTTPFGQESTANYFIELESILFDIGDHPGTGEDLVTAGLRAPGVMTRNAALNALLSWTKSLGQPIGEISDSLMKELKVLFAKEPDDETKEKIQSLIEGVIPGDDGEEDEENE